MIFRRGNVLFAFSTPLFRRQWPIEDPLHHQLRELILEKENASTGIQRAQAGGWHSEDDLLEWNAEAISTLQERLRLAIYEMLMAFSNGNEADLPDRCKILAWANVMRSGNYHRLHTHPQAAISGVYYIASGNTDEPGDEPSESGALVLPDPRLGVEMVATPGAPFGDKLQFPAKPGFLVAFPSWQPHLVNPFFGAGERISVAFNASFD